jgi:hypothetical protein
MDLLISIQMNNLLDKNGHKNGISTSLSEPECQEK